MAPAKQRQDQRWRLRRCKQKMPAARKTGVLGLGRRRASRRHEGSGHASDAPWRFFEHFELSSPFCSPSSHVITASASLASIHWCARFAFQPKNSTKSMPAKKQEEEASRLARPRTLPTGSPDGLTPESPRPAAATAGRPRTLSTGGRCPRGATSQCRGRPPPAAPPAPATTESRACDTWWEVRARSCEIAWERTPRMPHQMTDCSGIAHGVCHSTSSSHSSSSSKRRAARRRSSFSTSSRSAALDSSCRGAGRRRAWRGWW